jgi:D-xylose 1-dehydrogenase (NADP+, D-xylono-1,5-lactone-forming)
MDQILRWGFLSTANINRKVIPPIKDSNRHQLLGVASRSVEKAETYAAEHGFQKFYGSYDELLADPDIDVVYNSLPNHLHAEWTIKACQAGKHVLCEKPIVLSLAELDAVEKAAQSAGVVVQEAFMYRHHPQTLKIQELLAQNAIGKIRLARGVFTFFLTQPENVRLIAEYGGGCLWDVGVYPVNMIRTLIGLEPEAVFGVQTVDSQGLDIAFSGELMFPGGILGQFQSGFNANLYASVEILGETGSLVIPTPFFPYTDSEFTLVRDGLHEKIRVRGQDLYLGELDNMADCIFSGSLPRVTLEDSRKNTRAILACYESAKTGKIIQLK